MEKVNVSAGAAGWSSTSVVVSAAVVDCYFCPLVPPALQVDFVQL